MWSYAPPLRLAATFGPDSEVAASLREWVEGYDVAYHLNAEGSRVRVLAPGSSLTTIVSLSPPTLPRLAEHIGGWLHTHYGPGVLFDCQLAAGDVCLFVFIPDQVSNIFAGAVQFVRGHPLLRLISRGALHHTPPERLRFLTFQTDAANTLSVPVGAGASPEGGDVETYAAESGTPSSPGGGDEDACAEEAEAGTDLSLLQVSAQVLQQRRPTSPASLRAVPSPLRCGLGRKLSSPGGKRPPLVDESCPPPRLLSPLLAIGVACVRLHTARRMSHALPPLPAASPFFLLTAQVPAATVAVGMSHAPAISQHAGMARIQGVRPGTTCVLLVSFLSTLSAVPRRRLVCLASLLPFPLHVRLEAALCEGMSHAPHGRPSAGSLDIAAALRRPQLFFSLRAHLLSPLPFGIWPPCCAPFPYGVMTAGAQSSSSVSRAGSARSCLPAIPLSMGCRLPFTYIRTDLLAQEEPDGVLSLWPNTVPLTAARQLLLRGNFPVFLGADQ